MSNNYSCKNELPFVKKINNSSFNCKDEEGLRIILLLISIIFFIVYGYKYSKSFNIYYKISIIFILILIYKIYVNPIIILYTYSSILSLMIKTPEILDKNKYFPNHVQFENNNNFINIKNEVVTILNKTDNGNTLKLTKDSFSNENIGIGSHIINDGNKTRAWRILTIKIGNEYTQEAINNFPYLVKILNNIPEVVSCAISVLEKGVKIPIHIGYYKGVMRYMLPIIIPKDKNNVYLCVNEIKYHWTEGVGVLWDDTYPHKVYNNTDEIRVVIYMDVKRPLNKILTPINDLFIHLMATSNIAKEEIKKTEIQVKL